MGRRGRTDVGRRCCRIAARDALVHRDDARAASSRDLFHGREERLARRVDERPTGSHGDRERDVGHRQCRGVLHCEAVDSLRARLDRPDIGHTDVDDRRVIDFQHDLAAVVRSIRILGRAGQRCGERDRARPQRGFDIERRREARARRQPLRGADDARVAALLTRPVAASVEKAHRRRVLDVDGHRDVAGLLRSGVAVRKSDQRRLARVKARELIFAAEIELDVRPAGNAPQLFPHANLKRGRLKIHRQIDRPRTAVQ